MSLTRTGWARTRALRWLTDECIVIHREWQANSDGGQSLVETAESGTVPCRVVARTASGGNQTGAQPVTVTLWEVYLPHGTALGARDVLDVSGTRYEVAEDDDAVTDGVTLTVQVRRGA